MFILRIFINLYMFQATMCPSSGETTVFMWHLVLVILCGWLSGTKGGIPPFIPDSHAHRITRTKCHINTVVSPEDGHIVTQNMLILINILRINCAPNWFYLQDYTGMHGQQDRKFKLCMVTNAWYLWILSVILASCHPSGTNNFEEGP